MQPYAPRFLFVDLFAGGGGTSTAYYLATGINPDLAINHDAEALAVHAANHPSTWHLGGDIWDIDPHKATRGRAVGALWASPDCKHFSRAKGSAPRSDRVRSLAGVVLRWARAVRPTVIFLENVSEFTTWGPLDANGSPDRARRGESYRKWVASLRSLGYEVESQELRACDYGAATSRKRFFLIARCDGLPIAWPTPTHGPGLLPYRTARDIIDWTIPCPSIFGRKRPLAGKTLLRIARGLAKYGHRSLIQTGYGEREGQAPRTLDLDAPLGTIMAGGCKHALVTAFVAKNYGGHEGPGLSIDLPIGTITCVDHHSLVVGRRPSIHAAECRRWLDRYVCAGALPEVEDIGLRMLSPRELFNAQGFPADYIIAPSFGGVTLSQRAQQKLVGNSVSPPVAEALLRANLPASFARTKKKAA